MDRNSQDQETGYEAPSFEELPVTAGLAETAPGAVVYPVSPTY
jgi:hypothetical protein